MIDLHGSRIVILTLYIKAYDTIFCFASLGLGEQTMILARVFVADTSEQ